MSSGSPIANVGRSPWVSLGLFCLTYGVFGWIAGMMATTWQDWILTHDGWFFWEIDREIAAQMSWGFGLFLVLSLMILLAAPLKLIRLLFGSWLRSDTKAILSVLGWAFAAVVIICWFDQFARFFVLISAGILSHIDLQLCGLRTGQVFLILTVLSFISYATGNYLFMQQGQEVARLLMGLSFG
ncbi:MAG: hypothetical protein WBB82_16890 [Limnothrix sp.]